MAMTNAKRRPAALQRAAGLLAILLMVTSGALAADRLRLKESGQVASRRAAAALLPKLNAEIATGAWVEGTGVLMTPVVALAPDGRLEVHGLVCRGDRVPDARFIAACRRGEVHGATRTLLVDAAALDPSSLRVHQVDNGGVEALFACRGGAACITLPAQGKSFMRSSLICNDATSCNRVVIDLASLADFAAQPATVADAGPGALEATLKRMVSHMRRGYLLRRGTAATLMLNPTLGLHHGDSLEVQRVDCRSELASIDDLHFISDCNGGGLEGVTVDKRTVSIDVMAIDPGSPRVVTADGSQGAKGNWVAFGCRSGASCVSGNDPSESHRDGILACNDGPDCRHLVDDLGALIQLVTARAKAAP
jgi:hypothetical protein